MANPLMKNDAMSLVKMKTRQIWQQRWTDTPVSNKLRQIKLTLFCSGCRHGVAWGTNANAVDTHNLRAGAVL